MSKLLAQYELFKRVMEVPGAIVECGVFKGSSLARFAMFRELLANPFSKKLIAFDTFDRFPETSFQPDQEARDRFIRNGGAESIGKGQMEQVLRHKGCSRHVDLVAGDICHTVPKYFEGKPGLKISLINLDTDIYEPAVTILETLFPRLSQGGILIVDDYGVFPGETRAVDDYFRDRPEKIRKFPFCMTPCYIVKEKSA